MPVAGAELLKAAVATTWNAASAARISLVGGPITRYRFVSSPFSASARPALATPRKAPARATRVRTTPRRTMARWGRYQFQRSLFPDSEPSLTPLCRRVHHFHEVRTGVRGVASGRMAGTGPFSRRLRDRPDDQLPLTAGPVSNGEFVPAAAGARDRSGNGLIRASIDDAAPRTGVDRRRFLQGAGAVAASLAVFEFAGCASPSASHPQAASHPRGKGGRVNVPPPEDTAACQDALTGSEFIFDVHTHHVIPNGPWVDDAPETPSLVLSMPPAARTASTRPHCVTRPTSLH